MIPYKSAIFKIQYLGFQQFDFDEFCWEYFFGNRTKGGSQKVAVYMVMLSQKKITFFLCR